MTATEPEVDAAHECYSNAIMRSLGAATSYMSTHSIRDNTSMIHEASQAGLYHARVAHFAALEVVRLCFPKSTSDAFLRRIGITSWSDASPAPGTPAPDKSEASPGNSEER